MEADDATSRQDPSQGLQWGATIQSASNTLKKKKSLAVSKQPKDNQVRQLPLGCPYAACIAHKTYHDALQQQLQSYRTALTDLVLQVLMASTLSSGPFW